MVVWVNGWMTEPIDGRLRVGGAEGGRREGRLSPLRGRGRESK